VRCKGGVESGLLRPADSKDGLKERHLQVSSIRVSVQGIIGNAAASVM